VTAVCHFFQRIGVTTIRFDFCGTQVGRGYAQVRQVRHVARAALGGEFSTTADNNGNDGTSKASRECKSPPRHILLVGYSYGSLITSSASADIPECIGHVSIAPPYGAQHWLLMFHHNYHMRQAAQRQNLPRLFVIGSQDNFTSEDAFQKVVQETFQTLADGGDQQTTASVLKGADHFFAGRERDLTDVIGRWLLRAFDQHCRGDLMQFRDVEINAAHAQK